MRRTLFAIALIAVLAAGIVLVLDRASRGAFGSLFAAGLADAARMRNDPSWYGSSCVRLACM